MLSRAALGTPSEIWPRYTAVPMLPRNAMPNAYPNSLPVWAMPAADPAFSGGCGPDDEVGAQAHQRAAADAGESEPDHQGDEPGRRLDLGDDQQAGYRDGQT